MFLEIENLKALLAACFNISCKILFLITLGTLFTFNIIMGLRAYICGFTNLTCSYKPPILSPLFLSPILLFSSLHPFSIYTYRCFYSSLSWHNMCHSVPPSSLFTFFLCLYVPYIFLVLWQFYRVTMLSPTLQDIILYGKAKITVCKV